MRRFLTLVMVCCLLAFMPCAAALAGEAEEMGAATQKMREPLGTSEMLFAKGEFEASMKALLDVFPAASRTTAETVVLGNSLRKHDPKLAYDMHKLAAMSAPGNAQAQFEWAIDQQRAREWAGAAATYEAYDKLAPGFAPAYGLWAQCLIEVGKVKEASAMWKRSEAPGTHGSLREFQRLVCEANWQVSPFRTRRELFTKAKGGDLEAARKLVVLDANFPSNWWVQGPMPVYLAGDLEMLRRVLFTDGAGAGEIVDAAEIAQASVRRRVNLADFLKEKGYLFDAKGTLPKDPGAMSVIVGAAIARRTLTQEEAMDAWGPTVLKAAKAGKDGELLNVAATIYLGTDEQVKIHQFGWDNTQDERFAASLIVILFTTGKLEGDDPRLARALKEFPRNPQITGVNVALLAQGQKLTEQAVVGAIKAEYSRLSVVLPEGEPSARMIAEYFLILEALTKRKQKA